MSNLTQKYRNMAYAGPSNSVVQPPTGDDEGYETHSRPAPLMPLAVQTHPDRSGPCIRYCRECKIGYKDLPGFARNNVFARYCSFCGEEFIQHRCREGEPVVGLTLHEDRHVVDSSFPPPVRDVGEPGRQRARSRSPDTGFRNDVKCSRSSLARVQDVRYQHSAMPDKLQPSPKDRLDETEYELAPRSARMATTRKAGQHDARASDVDLKDPVIKVDTTPFIKSDTPHTYQEPIENIHRERAASPIDVDAYDVKRQYNPARELSYSPSEFHANIAKLREELSPVPNARTGHEQYEVEYKITNLRWREKEVNKKTKDLQTKCEKMPTVRHEDMKKEAIDAPKLAQAAWEQRWTKHQKNNLRSSKEDLNQSAMTVQDKIAAWQAKKEKKEKKTIMVDLTLEDD